MVLLVAIVQNLYHDTIADDGMSSEIICRYVRNVETALYARKRMRQHLYECAIHTLTDNGRARNTRVLCIPTLARPLSPNSPLSGELDTELLCAETVILLQLRCPLFLSVFLLFIVAASFLFILAVHTHI